MHIDTESGFAVYQHLLVDDRAPDYWQILAVAKAYAAETDCWINPEVNAGAVAARHKIYPGIEANANPDLTTDKYGYIDVKSPHCKNNIVINANKACNQNAIVVITDLEMDREVLTIAEAQKFTDRIYSGHNRNHFGKPNYTQDQVHWLIKGCLIKCNRSKKS